MATTLLYGGSFDPIHWGHLITAQSAMEQLAAVGVIFMPARVSPHKAGRMPGADAHHRLAMIHLAIAEEPRFTVSDLELTRPGPSFTIDTVESLLPTTPDLTLLIGQDQLPALHTWHRVGELLEKVKLGVLARPALSQEVHLKERLMTPESAADLVQNLGQTHASKVLSAQLHTPLIQISSTLIRQRVQAGLPIRFYVPLKVSSYIAEATLYNLKR